MSNNSDDDEVSNAAEDSGFQGTPNPPKSVSTSSGIPPPTKRRRKLKPQFDENGKPVVQRIRRRRRNGEIPEEDNDAPQNLFKNVLTPPGCRKPEPPLPDNNEQVGYFS